MKLRSFRTRIALALALLAGSALVGFGVTSWWLIYNAKVSRLDEAVKSQLMRSGRRPQSPEQWQFYEAMLPRIVGTDTETPIVLRVIGTDGNMLYQSSNWPADLKANGLLPPRSWPSPLSLPPLGKPRSLDPGIKRDPKKRFSPDRSYRVPLSLAEPQFTTQQTSRETWRVGVATFRRQVAIAVSLKTIDQEMVGIRNTFLISISVTLLLIAGGAWWLSGNALDPIRRLTIAIQHVTVKGLDQRVPIEGTDVELVELIQVFNQMLASLERSFKQASRFSGDAAHELKTPLAILQGELERTLQQAEAGSEVQQRLSSLLDEVRHLSGIVRKLLLLSLADAGQMSLHWVEVNLSEILAEMQEDVELLAPHLTVQTDIASKLWVQGDRDLLTQVLQNLVNNAIKYNLVNGWIQIQARQQQARVWVTIMNPSKNVLPEDPERIFERFYRGDPARTRKVEGTGLGLSLSREIARAHGGDLRLESSSSGQIGFTLSLPSS